MAVLQPQDGTSRIHFMRKRCFRPVDVLMFYRSQIQHKYCRFLLLGLCAVLAYEARTAGIGIELLAEWVADNVQRRNVRRTLIALEMSILPILSWIGWIAAVEVLNRVPAWPAYAYQTATITSMQRKLCGENM